MNWDLLLVGVPPETDVVDGLGVLDCGSRTLFFKKSEIFNLLAGEPTSAFSPEERDDFLAETGVLVLPGPFTTFIPLSSKVLMKASWFFDLTKLEIGLSFEFPFLEAENEQALVFSLPKKKNPSS